MPDDALSHPLEAHLGYWLRLVSNHVSHAFARKLAARGVTVAEWVVLRDLSVHAPAAPNELASRLRLTRGAISKLADRLEAKRLATRTPSMDDRRYQALTLTRAGRALVPALSALADRNDRDFFGHLPPAERATLEQAMKGLVRRHDMRGVPIE